MLTVKIIYKDGSTDLKDVWNVDEICLDNVKELRIIRDERKKVA
jgi:hypothetical protein